MPPDGTSPTAVSPPASAWPAALARLVVACVVAMLIARREWGEMAWQWWNSEAYSHILLVPPIIAWLAWQRREHVAPEAPRTSWVGVAALALVCLLWLGGRASGINLIAHAGAVAMLQALVLAVLGARVALLVLFPLGFMAFLVPFGEEIVPPLQQITARIAIALTHLSGIPARTDGIYIDTPAGLFIVAEACSGVRFLVAAIAIGVLVCFTAFTEWRRRLAFMLACIVVPIIANGIRAWGTIFVAQDHGVAFAKGFDHIIYGWVFFGLVLALLIGGARPFFQRVPEDAGWSRAEIQRLAITSRLARHDAPVAIVVVASLAIMAAAAIAAGLPTR